MAGHGYLAVGLLALLPSICLAAYVPWFNWVTSIFSLGACPSSVNHLGKKLLAHSDPRFERPVNPDRAWHRSRTHWSRAASSHSSGQFPQVTSKGQYIVFVQLPVTVSKQEHHYFRERPAA